MVGTAAYLAPEQARGEETTPAADVYALGVVLYQLLTGRLPWEGSTLAELAIRRENESPLPPTSYDPDVPETLSTAVLRSLEGEVAAATHPLASSRGRCEAGLRGDEPPSPSDELPTNMLAPVPTDVTRRMEPEPSTPVAPQAPPPPPPRRRRPRPQRGRRPPPSGRSARSPAACCA